MFKLLVEVSTMERINSLPKRLSDNIKGKIRGLKNNPFPDGKDKRRIKGTRNTIYRLRLGDYRLFYIIEIDNKIVKVTEFLTAEQAHKIYGRV